MRFIGFMNNQTVQQNKAFRYQIWTLQRLISAKFKIDIDRKGAFEIDRATGMVRYWSQSWPKSVTGTCEKLEVLKPKF